MQLQNLNVNSALQFKTKKSLSIQKVFLTGKQLSDHGIGQNVHLIFGTFFQQNKRKLQPNIMKQSNKV